MANTFARSFSFHAWCEDVMKLSCYEMTSLRKIDLRHDINGNVKELLHYYCCAWYYLQLDDIWIKEKGGRVKLTAERGFSLAQYHEKNMVQRFRSKCRHITHNITYKYNLLWADSLNKALPMYIYTHIPQQQANMGFWPLLLWSKIHITLRTNFQTPSGIKPTPSYLPGVRLDDYTIEAGLKTKIRTYQLRYSSLLLSFVPRMSNSGMRFAIYLQTHKR